MIGARVGRWVVFLSLGVGGGASAQAHTSHPGSAGERLGVVHFPTSCRPEVGPRFDRAVALLHSFEFGAAITGFRDVVAIDSSCAMAWWGIALSDWGNPMAPGVRAPAQLASGAAAVEAARLATATATERERGYVEAVGQLYAEYATTDQQSRVLRYEQSMSRLAAREPADAEAQIFHAIALTASASSADTTYARQLEAGAVLERLWAAQPDHPGLAHYIIHSYDYPALAGRAQAAAQRYARIAPSAAHALHMPSHIFSRTGAWEASIAANRRSIDIALQEGSIAEALHASDYLEYASLQLGRVTAAGAVLASLPGLAARFDSKAITGAAPGSAGVFALAAIPARYALERGDWAGAAALVPVRSDFPWTEAMTYFAKALGAAHGNDVRSASESIDSLTAIEQRLRARCEGYWAEQVAIQRLGAVAWLELAHQEADSALIHMREAALREDATEKSAVTPGPLAPARELLGEMLLALHRPDEALTGYRAVLAREPGRLRSLEGARRAALAAGDRKAAAQYGAELPKSSRP